MANPDNVFKIPLILLNACTMYLMNTAPNPPPPPQERDRFVANSAGDTLPMVEIRAPFIQKVGAYSAFLAKLTVGCRP